MLAQRQAARAAALWRSQLVKKYIMALSGLALFGFVFAHMLGNLKIFLGASSLNHYAEWLRDLGEPLLPRTGLLWLLRGGLVVAFVAHIVTAAQLTMINRKARPVRYGNPSDYHAATYASRTMRYTGVIVALFLLYHLAHYTWGIAHPDFIRGDVAHNMVVGFQSPVVALLYIAANIALGIHMSHGLWSMFQSLGLSGPRFDVFRKRFAQGAAALIVLGNVSMPIAIVTGFIK